MTLLCASMIVAAGHAVLYANSVKLPRVSVICVNSLSLSTHCKYNSYKLISALHDDVTFQEKPAKIAPASTIATFLKSLLSCEGDHVRHCRVPTGSLRALLLGSYPKGRAAAVVALGLGHHHHPAAYCRYRNICLRIRAC